MTEEAARYMDERRWIRICVDLPLEVYADLCERAAVHTDGDASELARRLIMLGLGFVCEAQQESCGWFTYEHDNESDE